LIGLGRDFYVWALSIFLMLFLIPILGGCSQAIWQAKVAPDAQGRVFAARLFIAQTSVPLAMLLAGPLADLVFEPSFRTGGGLAEAFEFLVGSGQERACRL